MDDTALLVGLACLTTTPDSQELTSIFSNDLGNGYGT
jgi:hypothetical protein